MKKFGIGILWVLGVVLLGGLGGVLVGGSGGGWYESLRRPVGTPPDWVFGPVWTVLYVMMGISLALLWARGGPARERRVALLWFAVQLALNLAWTPIFFGAQMLGWALVVIVCLWGAIGAAVWAARGVDRVASWLLVPYWIWVSYATYLNAGFWLLDRRG